MTSSSSFLTSLQVSLRDKNNGTFRGQLLLKNWTLYYNSDTDLSLNRDVIDSTAAPTVEPDDTGASYYVIAVVLVYGMSIVMLIASHINRKHTKATEDRQIHKYLQEFQIVKERSSQESYKDLKKKIKEQIQWDKERASKNRYLEKTLSHAVLPMIAITMPKMAEATSVTSLNHGGGGAPSLSRSRTSSRSSIGACSSPGSLPRSRSNSFGEASAPSRFGRFLALPEVGDMRATSPKLTRERRKGLAHLFQHKQAIDAHHLERILEESLDSRQGSFRRKDSKKSLRSNRSNSMTSLNDMTSSRPTSFLPSVVISEQSEKTNSAFELHTSDDATTAGDAAEAPSSDSGVMNQSNSNSPDVVIPMDDEQDQCDVSETTYFLANQIPGALNPDDLRETYISEEENEWAINTDSSADDETQDDEAYESGRYIARSLMSNTIPTSAYVMAQSRALAQQSRVSASRGVDCSSRSHELRCKQCDATVYPSLRGCSSAAHARGYDSDTSSSSAASVTYDSDDDDDAHELLYITTV